MTFHLCEQVPAELEADVLVAGGGLAGVSAAIAAARAGANTVLIERNGFLGGVATAGLCCSVFHCMATRDRQFRVKGLPLEIVDKLAVEAGPGLSWHKHKGHMIYDVEKAKLALHELCVEAGVRVLVNTPVSALWMESSALRGVIVTGENGLYAIKAGNVVDATGDSIVAELSGAPMQHRDKGMQNASKHSYVFRLGGVDVDAFVDYFRTHPDQYAQNMDVEWTLEEALKQYDENGTFLFPHGGGIQMSIVRDAIERGAFQKTLGMYDSLDAMQMHCIRSEGVAHIITGFTRINSLDAGTVTQAVLEGKRMAFFVGEFFKNHMPGFADSYVSATADDLGIRASRWIDGRCTFTREMRETAYGWSEAIGGGVIG